MSKTLYELQNLKHRYENGPVTLDIDALSVAEGSVTGLVGPNGSGKSTLLKILAFLEPWTDGRLLFEGQDVKGRERDLRRRATYLLQDSYLLKRNIFDNIAYGLRLRGETDGLRERVCDAMNRVGLAPDKFANRLWYRLSGGEVQRAALAARLALHPQVLLLDEPTANVDESSAQLVKDAALSAWKEWGTTVVIATHDLVWLYEVSTDIVSLYRGRVVGRGAENIIQGGWCREGGCFVKQLANGCVLRGVCKDEKGISGAVLSPDDVTISREEPLCGQAVNVLKGVVMQMALERGTDCILVSIEAAGLIIKARVTKDKIAAEGITPSAEVWLSFPADKLRWL